MKTCKICKNILSIESFHKKNMNKDGISNMCKSCHKNYQDSKFEIMSGYITQIKTFFGCCICGENDACCLDCHHVNPQTKLYVISAYRSMGSWKKLRNELNKCILLCSNCHRKVHTHNIDVSKFPKINTRHIDMIGSSETICRQFTYA